MAKTRLTYIYNTEALCKYRMNYQDMAIMDWIYSFVTSGKMAAKRIYDRKTKCYSTYWWLYYQALIDDFYNNEYGYTPLGITNRQVLARHIKSLARRKLIDFKTESFVNYGREKSEKGCYTMIRINLVAFGELTGNGLLELCADSFRNEKGEPMNVKEYSALLKKKEEEKKARKEKKRLNRPGAKATREYNRPKVNGSYGFKGKEGSREFVSRYNARMYNEVKEERPCPAEDVSRESCSLEKEDMPDRQEEKDSYCDEEGTKAYERKIDLEKEAENVRKDDPSFFIPQPYSQDGLDPKVETDIRTLENRFYDDSQLLKYDCEDRAVKIKEAYQHASSDKEKGIHTLTPEEEKLIKENERNIEEGHRILQETIEFLRNAKPETGQNEKKETLQYVVENDGFQHQGTMTRKEDESSFENPTDKTAMPYSGKYMKQETDSYCSWPYDSGYSKEGRTLPHSLEMTLDEIERNISGTEKQGKSHGA